MGLYKKKKSCIVYGNCVAEVLALYLAQHRQFGETYQIQYIRNFVHPTAGAAEIKSEELSQCALFLYQLGHLQYPEFIGVLPADCHKLSFPVMVFHSLWPLYRVDPRNISEPENGFVFGRFPYGDYLVMKLLRESLTPQQVYEHYMTTDIHQLKNLDELREADIQSGRELDAKCNLPIFPYIEAHFTTERLFWTPNHPAPKLLFIQLNLIYQALGMAELTHDTLDRMIKSPALSNLHHPINPQVIDHFNLQWVDKNSTYRYFDVGWFTFEEYLKKYIEFK